MTICSSFFLYRPIIMNMHEPIILETALHGKTHNCFVFVYTQQIPIHARCNDGVTVDGDTATVEFASTGPTTTFQCSVDGQSFSACELVQDTYTLQLVYCEDF